MSTPKPGGPGLDGSAVAFRVVAYFEAITFLVLLCASFVHRVLDGPDAIGVMGPVHGIAFLVYVVMALRIRDDQGWSFWNTVGVILLSAVPFGGFWAGSHLRSERDAARAS